MTDKSNKSMTEKELNELANMIVTKMLHLKTMDDWFEHVKASEAAASSDYETLEIPEEYEALGELAYLMTLMNLFTEDEAYEKCAVIKRRIEVVDQILNSFDNFDVDHE